MTAHTQKASRTGRSRKGGGFFGLALIGLGLIVLGVVAFVLMAPPESGTPQAPRNSVIPAEVHFPAPELSLIDLDGNSVSLDGLRGNFVLVNNWATWCPPCLEEMPTLEAFYREHQGKGFTLVGIEAGQPAQQVADFVEEYGLSFPIWLDAEGEALRGFFNNALPSSYLIDPGGTVVLAWTGAISQAALEQYVTPILEE